MWTVPGVPKVPKTKPDDRALCPLIHTASCYSYSRGFSVDYLYLQSTPKR